MFCRDHVEKILFLDFCDWAIKKHLFSGSCCKGVDTQTGTTSANQQVSVFRLDAGVTRRGRLLVAEMGQLVTVVQFG